MSFLFNGKKEVEGECGGYPIKHLEGLELRNSKMYNVISRFKVKNRVIIEEKIHMVLTKLNPSRAQAPKHSFLIKSLSSQMFFSGWCEA